MIGRRFGSLVVMARDHSGMRRTRWRCACDCGLSASVLGYHLTSGHTKSCGCLRRKGPTNCVKHGGSSDDEYATWRSMMARCYRPSTPCYPHYGGRGIGVCDRWRHDYSAFLADMGRKPSSRHSIDRIDPNGHYEARNCRWATPEVQSNNRRSSRYITIDGITMTVAQWARHSGIERHTLHSRVLRGWPVERLLIPPLVARKDGAR